jgi:transposase InsO family protein
VLLPARSPNLNAFIERFMRSLKDESLDRMIFFGEASLRRAPNEFMEHYHRERNHQGMGNALLDVQRHLDSRIKTTPIFPHPVAV